MIRYHPRRGSILLCNYGTCFKAPEMVKRRPVIVLSKDIKSRKGLCTVVSLSTTRPERVLNYHLELNLPDLTATRYSNKMWLKGDMVNTVSWERLDFIRLPKDHNGNRVYYQNILSDDVMENILKCVSNVII